MSKSMTALSIALALGAAGAALAANPARPAADTARDAARKPAEMVKFAGIKPGDKVGDLIPGSGYFTRVFADAVGPKGVVYAIVPSASVPKYPQFKVDAERMAATYSNIKASIVPLTAIAPAGSLDVVFTAQNYHDLNGPNPAQTYANKAAFAALKPGGVYVVVDHSAVAGSGLAATTTLHRIDEATVKAEVQAAGFKLDGESPVLRNKADPRTAIVFNPAIRGKTDQFALRFRKPK